MISLKNCITGFRFMKEFNNSKCIPPFLKTVQKLSDIKRSFKICKKIANRWKLWEKLSYWVRSCQKPCDTIGFKGVVKKYAWSDSEFPTVSLYFSSNEIIVQEEYLLYDLHDLIGIVGGNLGFFIGLSIFEIVKMIFSLINYSLMN